MIERYTLPEMGAIWTEEAKMRAWLDVEIAAVKAWNKLGKVPDDALAEIEAKADFDVARVAEIEATTNHDVIAFLTNVAEYVGDSSKYVHYGMTSSDMLDTGLALQIKRAGELLERDLVALGEVLQRRAFEFRDTVQVGRTHGIHAEPITFGMKLGMWAFEVSRHLKRMRMVTVNASVGKISGAVGAYNNIDPRVEDIVCEELGIGREPISNQVVQRDRHAAFLGCIAIVGSSIEKFATEIRHLQRTEVREAEEAFGKGQKGSSAMPHKRNPILSERMAGCARVLRGNAMVGLENVALWHERDISHSSAERIVFPDSCILLDYMLQKFTKLMDGLVVDEQRMLANLGQSYRLVFSGAVLLALVDKGMLREDAYRVVQDAAMGAWREGVDFGELIKQSAEAMAVMSPEEVDAAMDPGAVHGRPRRHLRPAGEAGVLGAKTAGRRRDGRPPRRAPSARLILSEDAAHDRAVLGGGAPRGAPVVEARVEHRRAAARALAALVVLEVLDGRAALGALDVEDVVRGPVDAILARASADVHPASRRRRPNPRSGTGFPREPPAQSSRPPGPAPHGSTRGP